MVMVAGAAAELSDWTKCGHLHQPTTHSCLTSVVRTKLYDGITPPLA
jgi:hypothetical protein